MVSKDNIGGGSSTNLADPLHQIQSTTNRVQSVAHDESRSVISSLSNIGRYDNPKAN